MKVEKCYANITDNCRGSISGEHIISRAVLGDRMTTENRPNAIARDSFKVNILCQGHNEDLSPFDAEKKRFLNILHDESLLYDSIRNGTADLSAFPYTFTIDGRKIENWLIKSAINYKYFMDGRRNFVFPFRYLIRRLFEGANYEFPFGLSIFQVDYQTNHLYEGKITFTYLWDEGELSGIICNMQGHIFFFGLPSLNSHLLIRAGVPFEGITYNLREYVPGERDEENFGTPTLIWHPGGIQQRVPDPNDQPVLRTDIRFTWQ